jgi:uroporphyrinogen-III decarboxylase
MQPLFSDILVPEAMGLPYEMVEKVGPQLSSNYQNGSTELIKKKE